MLKEKKVFIIAPSSPPKNNRWRKSFDILKKWSLKADFPADSLQPHLFHSNSDSKRAFFLRRAFNQKSSSAVWMLRGGYGCQKLSTVFSRLNLKNPKLFIGYSDGTALHLYLNAKNKVSLHAPAFSELNELSLKELNTLKSVLLGEKKQICFNKLRVFNSSALKKSKGRSSSPVKMLKGKITGGNLSLISTSVGAFKLPSTEFLFLEDVNEPAYKVDRLLHHLLYSGVLKSRKAILFGDFYPLKNKDLQEVFKSFSQSCSLPLIFGIPCGHSKRMPLVFNTMAELSLVGEKASLIVNTIK